MQHGHDLRAGAGQCSGGKGHLNFGAPQRRRDQGEPELHPEALFVAKRDAGHGGLGDESGADLGQIVRGFGRGFGVKAGCGVQSLVVIDGVAAWKRLKSWGAQIPWAVIDTMDGPSHPSPRRNRITRTEVPGHELA